MLDNCNRCFVCCLCVLSRLLLTKCRVKIYKYVGPPYSRTKIYAARVSCEADDAHRPLLRGFATAAHFAAAARRQTDGRTDGHHTVLIRGPRNNGRLIQ